MNKLGRIAAVALSIFSTGCLAPHYARPPIELPAGWGGDAATKDAATVGAEWWKVYGDAQLNGLVQEALAHNANLQLAVARVDEARALSGQARAEQYPSVSATASGSRTQASASTTMATLFPGMPLRTEDYRAGVNVSYELDIWGRLHNASKAARAELLATEAASEAVRITLAADVVQGYFALRALDEQVAATQRSLQTRSESLALQKMRYRVGAISEFEYRQLEAEVLAARAQLPALERQRAQTENALAVLLGKSPKMIYEGGAVPTAGNADSDTAAASLTVAVPAGLPSELLLRRPDLIESEQRLIAANARIGVARAAYFPSLSLTGLYGSESEKLANLFTGPAGIWQVAAAVTQPIWGAGRVSSQVAAANARQRQALAQYQQAIQNAFRDVRNAIVAQTKMREQFDAESQRAAALRDALRLAKLRYENGIASQLDVLDTERNLLAAELNRSEALRAQRAALADLFKALGGGYATVAAAQAAGAPPAPTATPASP